MRHGSELQTGHETNLVRAPAPAESAAYVFGVRDTQRDEYILEEFGFADDAAAAAIPALLRAAAGDLRRIAGWLPPQRRARSASEARARAQVERRRGTIYDGRTCSASQVERIAERLISATSSADFCWPTDQL